MISWTAHPFRRQRARGVGALVVVLAISFGLALVVQSVAWGAFAALVLLLSLESFFLPTRYSLEADAIRVQGVFSSSRRPYEQYRCVYEDRRGMTLSPYRRRARGRSFLEPYRATRLLLDGADPEWVRAALRVRLSEETEWSIARGAPDSDPARTHVVPT